MAKKKKGGKKKRVAAHIRENQGKRAALRLKGGDIGADTRAPVLAPPLGVGKPKRPREPAPTKEKDDPAQKEKERTEANNYLAAWLTVRKAKEAAEEAGVAPPATTGVWKFNKNTQAWLLRNIFSEDQIGERGFGTLCLYLEGLKGAGRQRLLSSAQEIIDKHGPDEGEEQTAAAREAAAVTATTAAGVETADAETAADESAAVVPSGYNSDSNDEEGEGASAAGAVKNVAEDGQIVGKRSGRGDVAAAAAAAAASGAGGFAFAFFNGSGSGAVTPSSSANIAAEARTQSDDSDSDSSSSKGSGDSDDENENGDGGRGGGGAVSGEASAPATKKPRKARSALSGRSKAEFKAKAAAVAYERALQVAEVLS